MIRDFVELPTFESKPVIQYWKPTTYHNDHKELVGSHLESYNRLRLRKHGNAVRIEIGNIDVIVDRTFLINILYNMQ